MLKNYFVIALRSFLRQKLYSILNIVGLSVGLFCSILIFLWINDEWKKDKFHENGDRIYVTLSNLLKLENGKIVTWTTTPGPLGEVMAENLSVIETAVRTVDNGLRLFKVGEKSLLQEGLYADPGFFQMFSFPILGGTRSQPVNDLNWVAISASTAQGLFGEKTGAVGKTVSIGDSGDFIVTTVFDDVSSQSSIKFDFILPFKVYQKEQVASTNWGMFNHITYFRLKAGSDIAEVTRMINEKTAASIDEADRDAVEFYLQPFEDHYLYSTFENGKPEGGRILFVQLFSVVGFFIFVIACINFMNMATARALNRAKEVGVRKVVGAERKSLISQFLYESFLISFLAMVVAVILVLLTLPAFNLLVEKQIGGVFFNPWFLIFLVCSVILATLLAGSYPAFVLSSFRPARVLKGSFGLDLQGQGLRKGLVIFQFIVTVVMVVSAIVVYRQIEFVRNKDLGYSKNGILVFPLKENLNRNREAFKNEIAKMPGVMSVSGASQYLVHISNHTNSPVWPGKPADSRELFRAVYADYDFAELMGFKLLDGRMFSRQFNDTANFLITRRTAEVMNLDKPIGQQISLWNKKGTIVGVIEDFHSRSLYEPLDPVIIMCQPELSNVLYVRYESDKTNAVVSELQSAYKNFESEYPLDFIFVDDQIRRMYGNDEIVGSLAIAFTMMALLISGLGLLGLTAYTTQRKRKEISIRKTLGASVSHLVTKMSADFAKLSLIAVIVGCPLAYVIMSRFLETYAYHTNVSWGIFVLSAFFIMAVTLAIVIYQVVRAAAENPVDVLRNE